MSSVNWLPSLMLGVLLQTGLCASAQDTSDTTHPLRTVYVLRPNRYTGALASIRVGINNKEVSLGNNTYATTTYRADTVIVKLLNVRLSGQAAKPLISYKDTSYFVTLPEEHASKKNRLILVEVDKESYEHYAEKIGKQEPIP